MKVYLIGRYRTLDGKQHVYWFSQRSGPGMVNDFLGSTGEATPFASRADAEAYAERFNRYLGLNVFVREFETETLYA